MNNLKNIMSTVSILLIISVIYSIMVIGLSLSMELNYTASLMGRLWYPYVFFIVLTGPLALLISPSLGIFFKIFYFLLFTSIFVLCCSYLRYKSKILSIIVISLWCVLGFFLALDVPML